MSSTKGLVFLKTVSDFMFKGKHFASTLKKVSIVSGGDGKCTAEFTVAEEHMNEGGGLHGGFTATAVDVISTIALMTKSDDTPPGVSVDIHVTYLKAAKEGDVVVIEADTIRAGKNLAFLECNLKHKKDGSLIAKGSHTKYVGMPK